jgi:hypothetical protein
MAAEPTKSWPREGYRPEWLAVSLYKRTKGPATPDPAIAGLRHFADNMTARRRLWWSICHDWRLERRCPYL